MAMSADGSRVAIGAFQNDGNGSNSGHARVYQWTGASWLKIGQDIDGEAADDNSGFSVALPGDGERLTVGAYRNDGNGSNSGHVRLYYDNGGSWVQLGQDIDGAAAGDEFGFDVAMSADGRRVAISSQEYLQGPGHVRVFQYKGTVHVGFGWEQIGQDIDGAAANDLTRRVALSADGSRVAVTSFYANNGGAQNVGSARVFVRRHGDVKSKVVTHRLTVDVQS